MELNYFYKAEMPNYQYWTLDISKLNILLIWDRTIQTTIKMNLNNPKYLLVMATELWLNSSINFTNANSALSLFIL